MEKCQTCVHKYIYGGVKSETPPSKMMKFYNEGMIECAMMKRYDPTFYEIVEGKYKGNLIHVFNVISK